MSLQKLLADLADEHEALEEGHPSPFMRQMELYYLAHPAGFRGKIMLASWIDRASRKHMIAHVAAGLAREAAARKRERRVSFAVFARESAAKKAQTKRFVYGKHEDGTVWKRSRKTGRFTRFSQREKEVLRKRAS